MSKFSATAYILIGGKSRRFGEPKWAIEIDGKSVLDRIWEVCDRNFESVFLVAKKYQRFEKPMISDEIDISAPIAGVFTALRHTKTDWNFIISCDLPLLDDKIIDLLWRNRSAEIDVVLPKSGGKLQVLCGFYRKNVIKICEDQITADRLALYTLVKMCRHKAIAVSDPSLINMNTPKDLRQILLQKS